MNIKPMISALALTGALLLTSCSAASTAPTTATADPTPVAVATTTAPHAPELTASPVCEEDMPCWDCATMGNRMCGPQTPALTAPAVEASAVPVELPVIVEAPIVEVAPVAPAPVEIEPVVDVAPVIDYTAERLAEESAKFNNYNYIPTDELCTVTYLGTSTQDLTDGDTVWSVQSEVDPTLWHSYDVVLTPTK